MFKHTNRQLSLRSRLTSIPEGALTRLTSSWGERFRREVFPILLAEEAQFADLYATEGRPNWSVARLIGILILASFADLPDQDALDRLSFDLRWQHALDLDGTEAYLSRRSLVAFRTRLAEGDPEGRLLRRVFERLGEAQVTALSLSIKGQRLDSTHVISDIRTRGRLWLFSSTLVSFLVELRTFDAGRLQQLSTGLRAWFQAREDEDHDVVLGADKLALARWLVEVRDTFAVDEVVTALPGYQLVARLVREHVTLVPATSTPIPPTGEPSPGGTGAAGEPGSAEPTGTPGGSIISLHKPSTPSTSLQSPHDPDAGYGHKGVGYEVQLAETYGNGDRPEVILAVHVHPSGPPDCTQLEKVIIDLVERGVPPTDLQTDMAYNTVDNIEIALAHGINLAGPIPASHRRPDLIGRESWQAVPGTGVLVACPSGHAVINHVERKIGTQSRPFAIVSGAACRACPMASRCIARPIQRSLANDGRGQWEVEESRALLFRDRRLREQETKEWKATYNMRAGIESTNAELKKRHGLGRLRVRRLSRVHIAVLSKVMACNLKRWFSHPTQG